MNEHEQKQERRRERLERASDRASERSAAGFKAAKAIADHIPLGQPILIGHHSEGRHRRDLARIDSGMRKGVEEEKRAKELAYRAAAVGSGGVSSDDPDAVAKLKEELGKLEDLQRRMKLANAIVRSKRDEADKLAALIALGLKENRARECLTGDSCGRLGFPDYALGNNSANMRRIRRRIENLERLNKQQAEARAGEREPEVVALYDVAGLGRVAVTDDILENRTLIRSPGKPAEAIRTALKRAGFRWSPDRGAWSRHLGAAHAASYALRPFASAGWEHPNKVYQPLATLPAPVPEGREVAETTAEQDRAELIETLTGQEAGEPIDPENPGT